MVNAVFIQNPQSIYKDRPGEAYHFPKQYLNVVQECVGDWVIFYEGRKGAFGYVSVQKVRSVGPDPHQEDHHYAWLDPATQWEFECVVPRNNGAGVAYERSLRSSNGRAMSGGANTSAVRRLSFDEFSEIVMAGLQPQNGPEALPRNASEIAYEFSEGQMPFHGAPISNIREKILSSRAARAQSFARMVKAAYRGRCAISGLDLRNGGGRAEVQAAHIRPVQHDGPDIVINGLALSGTLHWMFDRGLIGIGENYEILVSENKVPFEVRQRLISPTGRLHLPEDRRHYPHPDYIRFHRENIFGNAA
ncbi:MAG: HNH endonuclease [Marinovum algicola]|uniref:Restriction endonuclease n=3 Tax=Roseobacteraceae TaxID=2854170 RepID=A0A975WC41_9RHOB|nr:HNH endonuclease [Marinovum sp. SP66]SEJ86046.1 putative restriction endonuclease [Marinovum algicola]SLN67686.1 hypothetical protein MAA5396_03656 [Marinovum algicola]